MKRYLIITVIILAGAITGLCFLLKKEKAETKRLNGNQRSLFEDVMFYKTKDSLSASSVERLQLTNREFEKYCSDLKQTVDNLNIKIRRLQSVSETGTETRYEVKTMLKDSIVMRDSLVTLKCIELHTPYLDLSGCIEGDSFSGSILSRDTLVHVVHRVPYQFWFIKWGCKAVRLDVVSKNPHSRITYSQYIELR